MHKFSFLTAVTEQNYVPRYEQYNGRRHIVVPVTLMVEGVHAGSAGPVFYSGPEISAHYWAWDGMPVPIGHPSDTQGNYISANSPRVLEEWSVGRLFNTRFDAGKMALQSEIWADVALLQRRDPVLLAQLEAGELVEVSTGMSFDAPGDAGVWNSEEFFTSAINIRPDHLALLPGQRGACSTIDGCGVRVHVANGCECGEEAIITTAKSLLSEERENDMEFIYANAISKGAVYAGLAKLGVCAASMEDIHHKLQHLADGLDRTDPDGTTVLHWAHATSRNENVVVLRVRRSPREGQGTEKFFRTTFQVDGDGAPTVINTDNMQEVTERRTFEPVPSGMATNEEITADNPEADVVEPSTTNNEEEDMATKTELVQGLIDNAATQYTDADKESLMAMNEAFLAKMTPVDNEEKPPTEEPAPVAPADALEAVNSMPDGPAKTQLQELIAANDAEKTALVEKLAANETVPMDKLALNELTLPGLRAMSALAINAALEVEPTADFTGMGAPQIQTHAGTNEVSALALPRTEKIQ